MCVCVSVNYATAEKQFARKPRKFMLRLNVCRLNEMWVTLGGTFRIYPEIEGMGTGVCTEKAHHKWLNSRPTLSMNI